MNGVLHVKFYAPKSQHLNDYTARWIERLKLETTWTTHLLNQSFFYLQGYDTIWAAAQPTEKVGITDKKSQNDNRKNSTCLGTQGTSKVGPEILDVILHNQFRGLSADFDLATGGDHFFIHSR